MKATHRRLLVIDAGINLLLGGLLLLFPSGIAAWLGVPPAASAFYPTILGGVLFGIGLALLLEANDRGQAPAEIDGAGVLTFWLIFVPLEIPLRGQILLWVIAVTVLAVGLVELCSGSWRNR